ncbi:TetR/AcrR family transcriptional regulator [Nonomuraea basaltis]|uniref:TetR/AcrR family transcriptional regulator n=1 Tax=Nonomuraea basaltis TaxID=2495887 RepID=UPI00110C671D|nr:TetR family transcriptional regulator [Nonomuraea basaltis]TMR88960.1 TetR family transcriptional regulator [Nonomuraea basaltis]
MNARKYEQRLRAEAAEETRRRILDVMYDRVSTAPAETISLDQVARTAGVARSTIYTIFESRAGLFDALFHHLLDRAGFERIVTAVAHPDAREHLRGSLRAGAEVYASERDVTRAVYSMAALNPDAMAGTVRRDEQGRAEGMRHLAQRLADQDLLRPDVTVEEATDILYVITSFDTFDLLHTGRARAPETVADRLITMAERALLR